MQVQPDWRQQMTVAVFNKELPTLVFKGPGFYLSKTDTVLVTPLPPDNSPTIDNVWNSKQPDGTIYEVFVYNIPFNQTIFAAVAVAPCRQDDRTEDMQEDDR